MDTGVIQSVSGKDGSQEHMSFSLVFSFNDSAFIVKSWALF